MMGSVLGDVLGIGQGDAATAQNVVNPDQVAAANTASNAALQAQQALANQLMATPGIQNQSNVFNQQQALANQLQGAAGNTAGVQNQADIFAQQQALANQLQNQAMGQGPNPAQAQFQQNLNAATQNAAGTISSQKGISPALAAELIARQQGAANQNAAGGAATLQAQQQVAAQQALQAQQAQMQQTAQTQAAQQIQAQQQLAAQQQALQGTAQTQIGNAANAAGNATSAAQAQQSMLLNGYNQVANANASNQNAMSMQNSAAMDKMMGGLVSGAATGGITALVPAAAPALAALAASDERVKENVSEFDVEAFLDSLTGYEYDYKDPQKHGEGKQVGVMAQDVEKEAPNLVVENKDGVKMIDYNKAGGPLFASLAEINKRLKKIEGAESQKMAEGGILKENYTVPDKSKPIPGEPKVDGNSYSNDVVPALLSPKEIVIPLDVLNSKDPAEASKKFVQSILDKENSKAKDPKSDKAEFDKALRDAMSKRKK